MATANPGVCGTQLDILTKTFKPMLVQLLLPNTMFLTGLHAFLTREEMDHLQTLVGLAKRTEAVCKLLYILSRCKTPDGVYTAFITSLKSNKMEYLADMIERGLNPSDNLKVYSHIIETFTPAFVEQVDPIAMLPYLIQCLTAEERSTVTHMQDQRSSERAAMKLLVYLELHGEDCLGPMINALNKTRRRRLAGAIRNAASGYLPVEIEDEDLPFTNAAEQADDFWRSNNLKSRNSDHNNHRPRSPSQADDPRSRRKSSFKDHLLRVIQKAFDSDDSQNEDEEGLSLQPSEIGEFGGEYRSLSHGTDAQSAAPPDDEYDEALEDSENWENECRYGINSEEEDFDSEVKDYDEDKDIAKVGLPYSSLKSVTPEPTAYCNFRKPLGPKSKPNNFINAHFGKAAKTDLVCVTPIQKTAEMPETHFTPTPQEASKKTTNRLTTNKKHKQVSKSKSVPAILPSVTKPPERVQPRNERRSLPVTASKRGSPPPCPRGKTKPTSVSVQPESRVAKQAKTPKSASTAATDYPSVTKPPERVQPRNDRRSLPVTASKRRSPPPCPRSKTKPTSVSVQPESRVAKQVKTPKPASKATEYRKGEAVSDEKYDESASITGRVQKVEARWRTDCCKNCTKSDTCNSVGKRNALKCTKCGQKQEDSELVNRLEVEVTLVTRDKRNVTKPLYHRELHAFFRANGDAISDYRRKDDYKTYLKDQKTLCLKLDANRDVIKISK